MKKWKTGALGLGAALLAGALVGRVLPGCGGDSSGPTCGNGEVETGEFCDDGNLSNDDNCSASCTVLATTSLTLKWPINQGKFQDPTDIDSCVAVGGTHVVVTLKGGTPPAGGLPVDRRLELGCDLGSTKLLNVPSAPLYPGPYEAKVKLIKRVAANDAGVASGDTDLTRELTLNFTLADRTATTQTADFQIPDFLMGYTGGLQFKTRWASATTCASATPPVTQQVLLLKKRNGTVVSKMTFDSPLTATVNEAMPTDGSAPGVCVDFSASTSQQIFGLDWGDYDIGIKGMSNGMPAYCQTFPVFVGAQAPGTTNPSYTLMVPALMGMMTADASVGDGGVPDGGMSITCF